MKTLAVNSKNDLVLDASGNLSLLDGLLCVTQTCEQVVKTQLGELELYITRGIPNFNAIWKGAPNIPQFEQALRNTILSVNGILEIKTLVIDSVGDTLRYDLTVKSIYGMATVNGEL